MRSFITTPVLILEGKIRTTNDGTVLTNGYGRPITVGNLTRRILSLQSSDIHVMQTPDQTGTATLLVEMYAWSQATTHSTATVRPKPRGDWGTPSSRDWQIHLLCSLPGVGPELAAAILDTLGRCPIVVDASEAELLTVPGIGKGRARKILAAVQKRGSEMPGVET